MDSRIEKKTLKKKAEIMGLQMAPYLKAVLNYKQANSKSELNSFQHTSQINLDEHNPNKLTEVKKVKWDQAVMSHSISW